jgi:hypothetical protein
MQNQKILKAHRVYADSKIIFSVKIRVHCFENKTPILFSSAWGFVLVIYTYFELF